MLFYVLVVTIPWGRLGGRTGWSSPPQGCPALELPRQYTAGSPSQRCRTGRRWWCVWSASACPAKQRKKHFFLQRLALPHTTKRCSEESDTAYMDGHDRQVDVVEQFIVEFHRHTGREEDHQLLLAVLLQEGEEQHEALLWWAYHVTLKHTTSYQFIYRIHHSVD